MMPEEKVRRQVFYSGQVQGVFFRATTEELASDLAVTGFVRNLPDGRVELEVQGDEMEIARLLAAIEDRYRGHITGIQTAKIPPERDERGFEMQR